MSISTRITSMYENIGEVYDTITNVILPEHKNIENIPRTIRDSYLEIINNGINVIYDNWEKVTGEGTSLTLTPTEEAPMQLVPKGNTYQTQYTGKNLYNDNFSDYTQPVNYRICPITLTQGQTYVLKGNKIGTTITGTVVAVVPYGEQYTDFSTQLKMAVDSQGYGHTLTFTPDSTWTSPKLAIYASDKTTFDNLFTNYEIQLEKGSAATSYEPYTNGPSPNPSYPQDIHVVSGDNSIEVVGYNKLKYPYRDTTKTTNGITFTDLGDGSIKVNGTATANAYFYLTAINDTYYKNMHDQTLRLIGCPSGGSNSTYRLIFCTDNWAGVIDTGNGSNFVVEDTYYNQAFIQVYNGATINNLIFKPMLTTDTSATMSDYEPYTSQSYPINLPVENLFTFGNLTEETRNGVTKTITGSKINLNGTTTSAIDIVQRTNTGVHLKAGTYAYTLFVDGTITVPSGSGSNTALLFTNSSNTSVFNGTMVSLKENGKLTGTFTLNADTDLYLQIYSNSSGQAFNCNLYCQIEKGIKANHYTPYGTTPIWLGWIPNTTYQDKIDKSSGKNLTNIDDYLGGSVGSNGTISANDHITSFTNTNGVITFTTSTTYRGTYSDYIEVEPSTSYVISFDKPTTGVTYFGFFNWYDTNKTFIGRDSISTPNRTSPSNAKYCVMFLGINEVGTAKITNIMLNKGTTALPYEPYGTSWYLKKEIGKVVLNGQETWYMWSANLTNTERFYTNVDGYNFEYALCEQFRYMNGNQDEEHYRFSTSGGANKQFVVFVNKDRLSGLTATGMKNWVQNNNLTLYAKLATPTYTLIEGELLNQLEAIKMSYEGQTNLSQTNNDMPFILNPSALKKV